MCKINFTPFPDITTERLYLRQLTLEDENEIFFLKSDEEVLKFLDKPRAKVMEEARQYINKVNNGIAKNDWVFWAITLKGNSQLVGTICIWNISIDQSKAEIGYDLIPSYQRKGIMQEALTAIIEYSFQSMKLASVEAFTSSHNLKSVRLLERNNFKKEDNSTEDNSSAENPFDMVIYSLINNARG